MGFFDKVMFWKHKEMPIEPGAPLPGLGSLPDPNFDTGLDNLGLNKTGLEGGMPAQPMQMPPTPGIQQGLDLSTPTGNMRPMQQQAPQDIIMTKNMEVISSKLDALQASLESISQRISTIERIAEIEQQKANQKRYSY